jgi:hypothetical protein
LTVRCNQATALVLTGAIRELPGAAHSEVHRKTLRLRALRTTARDNRTMVLVVRLPGAALLALGAGRHESATFKLAATNGNGTRTAAIHVRRLIPVRRTSKPPSRTKSGTGATPRFESDLGAVVRSVT